LCFYLFLVVAVAAYLALVEVGKRLFYRYVAPRSMKMGNIVSP